jgi:hypothetical protein
MKLSECVEWVVRRFLNEVYAYVGYLLDIGLAGVQQDQVAKM